MGLIEMTHSPLLCPIVGAWHRPPAKTVLEHLATGTELVLSPETSNPHDEFAIKVFVDLAGLESGVREALVAALDEAGSDFVELLEAGLFQLGYCAATNGKPLGKIAAAWAQSGLQAAGNVAVGEMMMESRHEAKLAFGPDGTPAVRVTRPDGEDTPGWEESNWGNKVE